MGSTYNSKTSLKLKVLGCVMPGGPRRTEDSVGIGELRSTEEGEIPFILECINVGVHPLVRPDGIPPPLPVFYHLGVDLVDDPADFGQPVAQVRDQFANPLGGAEAIRTSGGHSFPPRM